MTTLKNILILSLCLLITACQKRKYPEERVQLDDKDVYFNGLFGNESIALNIDEAGYYCYSSYKQGVDSIYVFEADLKKYDCNPCPLSFRLEMSDYRQRVPGSPVVADSSFRVGSRRFIPGVSRPIKVRFASHSNKEVSSLQWNASNGDSSQDSIMNSEFAQPGPQKISLTVRTIENCVSTVVNKIFIGGTGGLFACDITAQSLQDKNVQFKSNIIGGKAPYRYTWNFGDGQSSNLPDPTLAYKWAGSYPVNLKIVDADDHVCESNYIYIAGNDMSSCTANISMSYIGSRDAFLEGVKIQWTDQSNVVYKSESVTQPVGSYFEVVNSQPYAPNERGENGRMLTLRFNALLSDGDRQVWIRSERTALAVTYK